MTQVEGSWSKAKWVAALLVAGYLLGKVITVFFGYKVARWLWAWRKRRAEAAAGAAEAAPEQLTAPLLGDSAAGQASTLLVVEGVAEGGTAADGNHADGQVSAGGQAATLIVVEDVAGDGAADGRSSAGALLSSGGREADGEAAERPPGKGEDAAASGGQAGEGV